MSYEEKIEKLFNRFPSYQVVGGKAYKPGLDTMKEFDAFLGHPHRNYDTIHVAGTNGKGSVSSMLAAALSGKMRVGLYTSPHLSDFRERIKIISAEGCSLIPRSAVEAFLDNAEDFMQRRDPSFFEITTAMALDFFSREKVDMAVIECGLGGRLDSTNIITPRLSVITNISLEHTAYLGDTPEKIAFEKAGIIKEGVDAVVGEFTPSTRTVFEEVAAKRHAPLIFATEHESPIRLECGRLDLKGDYQRQNLRTVKAALDTLSCSGCAEFDVERICRTASLTAFHGRWETLSHRPDIICDIGHNAHGLLPVFSQLQKVRKGYGHIYIVFGVVSDKDVDAIAPAMPIPDYRVSYILTQPSTGRAMPVATLCDKLSKYGIAGQTSPTVAKALDEAKTQAAPDDLIFIGGSNFIVSDAVAALSIQK